jgi:hypothetical protein
MAESVSIILIKMVPDNDDVRDHGEASKRHESMRHGTKERKGSKY